MALRAEVREHLGTIEDLEARLAHLRLRVVK